LSIPKLENIGIYIAVAVTDKWRNLILAVTFTVRGNRTQEQFKFENASGHYTYAKQVGD